MTDKTLDPCGSDSSTEFDACRAAFVAKIKDENLYREPWARESIKAHWTGAKGGFASERLNNRWEDFRAGWLASNTEAERQP